jgi:hypothetical protein
MMGRNCTIIGSGGATGMTMGEGTGAPAVEDELLDEDLKPPPAPPPPLVREPTEATEAVRAEERSDPKLEESVAVADDNRFSSHSAIWNRSI